MAGSEQPSQIQTRSMQPEPSEVAAGGIHRWLEILDRSQVVAAVVAVAAPELEPA